MSGFAGEGAARSEGDVGEIAPAGGIVADLHIGIENRRVALADGVDEVLLMNAVTAISLELFDDRPVLVECRASSSLSFEAAAFAVCDVTAAGCRAVGQIGDLLDQIYGAHDQSDLGLVV